MVFQVQVEGGPLRRVRARGAARARAELLAQRRAPEPAPEGHDGGVRRPSARPQGMCPVQRLDQSIRGHADYAVSGERHVSERSPRDLVPVAGAHAAGRGVAVVHQLEVLRRPLREQAGRLHLLLGEVFV